LQPLVERAVVAQRLATLFVVDPLDELKAYKDTSVAMMRELARRDIAVFACTPAQLALRDGKVLAQASELELPASDDTWYVERGATTAPLTQFAAVLMRKDPPFDVEFLNATLLLSRAAAQGARVFNDPQSLRDHNEKLAVAEFPQYTVPTLVTRDLKLLREFHAEMGDVVVKPLDGMGGRGVFRLRRDDPNLNAILEIVSEYGKRSLMAQRFIPEITAGDKRVLLIAGKPVPFSLARVPKPGESRGNLAAMRRSAADSGCARPSADRAGRDWRLPDRGQCHQPYLLRGDHAAKRVRRRIHVRGRAAGCGGTQVNSHTLRRTTRVARRS
jgi:glutathione synthase